MRFATLFSGLFLFLIAPVAVTAEEIISFTADYEIKADASVEVTETINYDFGTDYRHGIFRTLNTNHAEPASVWFKDRYVEVSDIAVTLNNEAVPFTLSGKDKLEIKIGDADTTITGHNLYTISYTLVGALSYFDESETELYWNVTGTDWLVGMAAVTVNIKSEVPLIKSSCYFGVTGAATLCEQDFEQANSYKVINLQAGSGVTAAALLKSSNLPTVVKERVNYVPIILGFGLMALLWVLISAWRYRKHYHKDRPVIAEYEPYPGVEPMMAGTLIDDRLDPKDVSAGVVYLAEQGFLKIKKTERKVVWLFDVTDYEVTLLRPVSEVPSEFLKQVINLFFKDSLEVGTMVSLASIKGDAETRIDNSAILRDLNTAIKADLTKAGFFENRSVSFTKSVLPVLVIILMFVLGVSGLVHSALAWLVGGAASLWSLDALLRYRRRTAIGYEAMYHLKGFKLFLSVTDKERFDFHNAPERSPEQFMKFLPYAIAFGVEEKWAKVFSDMQITNPSWYESNSAGAAFVATDFAHDLTSFSSAVTTSTSASSGGGSVGGGGGGGGGGSW